MEKRKMAIAVFAAVMATASAAQAGGLGLDLGKLNALRNASFDTAGAGCAEVDASAVPEPGRSAPVPAFDSAAARASASGDAAQGEDLDGFIKASIAYAEADGKPRLIGKMIKLLQEGTLAEKSAFVHNNGNSYSFPDRFSVKYGGQQTCVASHKEQSCINQNVCRIVCVASGVAVGGAAGAIGGSVCSELCELVPKCSTATICDQWVTEPMNHGQDSHGNWE